MARSILLNGTSSSGKTSIAKELEKLLPSYTYFALDDCAMEWEKKNAERLRRLNRRISRLGKAHPKLRKTLDEITMEVVFGYHSSIAQGMDKGTNYILDHVLWWQSVIGSCVAKLAPYDIVLVGVHCPLRTLKRREEARGDRLIGIAEMQFPHVHQGKKYDLEVHTNRMRPRRCAVMIADFVKTMDSSVYVPFSEKFYAVE